MKEIDNGGIPNHSPDFRETTLPFQYFVAELTVGVNTPNEDAVFSDGSFGVIGVFDGLGGATRGDMASSLAKKAFQRRTQLHLAVGQTEVESALSQAWEETKSAISCFEDSAEIHPGRCATTATVAKVYHDGNKHMLSYLHAGDSRIYLRKKDGTIQKLTYDETPLFLDASEGKFPIDEAITIDEAFDNAQSEEDAFYAGSGKIDALFYWNRRMALTNSLHTKSNSYLLKTIPLSDDVTHVFCVTDGISDVLTRRQIEKAFQLTNNPNNLVQLINSLVEGVNKRNDLEFRAKNDDRSVAVLSLETNAIESAQKLAEPQEIDAWVKEILSQDRLNPYRGFKVDGVAMGEFEISLSDLRYHIVFPGYIHGASVDTVKKINDEKLDCFDDNKKLVITNPAVQFARNRKGHILKRWVKIPIVVEYSYLAYNSILSRKTGEPVFDELKIARKPIELLVASSRIKSASLQQVINRHGKLLYAFTPVTPIKRLPRSANHSFEDESPIPDFGKAKIY